MTSDSGNREAAGSVLAASSHRVRLTPKMLRELRMALLSYGSPFTSELELVEERHGNGDVVVRLARPDKPQSGELILGHRTEGQQAASDSLGQLVTGDQLGMNVFVDGRLCDPESPLDATGGEAA